MLSLGVGRHALRYSFVRLARRMSVRKMVGRMEQMQASETSSLSNQRPLCLPTSMGDARVALITLVAFVCVNWRAKCCCFWCLGGGSVAGRFDEGRLDEFITHSNNTATTRHHKNKHTASLLHPLSPRLGRRRNTWPVEAGERGGSSQASTISSSNGPHRQGAQHSARQR